MPAIRRQGWVSQKERLDRLFGYFERLPKLEPEIRSHWVRYLVVLTSGFLETSIAYIYTEYSQEASAPRVAKYVAARLSAPGNMKMDKLERLIRDFDDDWFEEIQKTEDFDQISSAVQSVVSNRNRVAHGEDISATIGQLSNYFDSIVKLLDFLTEQCDKELQRGNIRRHSRRARRS